jgi:polyisoprenyl-phosphate glycosyltransferase
MTSVSPNESSRIEPRTPSLSEEKHVPTPRELPPVPLISIVVPAFNEERNVPLLAQQISEVLGQLSDVSWELIFVDDGSRDATWEGVCRLSADVSNVKGIRLSRNFGHQYALMAGLKASDGDAVITMDCDFQHPVELLPLLIQKWREGFRVVKTKRGDLEDLGFFKKWTSRLFYRLFSLLSGVEMQPGLADFRLLDRQALTELLRFKEEGLFLRGLTEWIGFSACVIPYQAGRRIHGRSQYSLNKMVKLGWRGVSSFSIMPLRIGIFIGLAGSLLSVGGVLYAFFGKFFGYGVVPGWASTLMVISLLFFLLFIYLGILGEYIGRMVIELRQRPRFIVCDTTGAFRRAPALYD